MRIFLCEPAGWKTAVVLYLEEGCEASGGHVGLRFELCHDQTIVDVSAQPQRGTEDLTRIYTETAREQSFRTVYLEFGT